ncbi:MAG TPA: efflux transporter outer membrane subunit [candidate division Zixibacteria bacterium]|nr:efflux transporter outer membrane subunit [candidate division Zixibacteria bacterium]
MRRSTNFVNAIFVVLISLCSFAAGADKERPKVETPSAFKELGNWKPSEPADQLSKGKWWERFNDPELNRLEESLNISNQNIAASVANVEASRAIVRQARSQYFPLVTAGASLTRSRQPIGPSGATASTYSGTLDASWEPDVFGRVRASVKAGKLGYQVSVADLENVRLSAETQLAVNYFVLRTQDDLQQILDSTVNAYQDALDVARARYTAGLDSDESVAQAETQLKTTEAQAVNVGVLRAQYEHAIAVLVGKPASSFSLPAQVIALTPPAVPVGVPSELLERRPDIAAEERAVMQSNAQVGLAKKAFFPTLLLTASGGFEGNSVSNWFNWPDRLWSVGTSLTQTIFDGGSRRATVQQAQAAYKASVANYRQTVLTAFQQVEDNLAAVRILSQVIQEQDAAVESAKRTLGEADVRYRSGIDPYLNVITAQTALLNAQESALTFRQQQITASVNLINALGGGWDISQLH